MDTNKNLTNEESLSIITDMIQTAKGNVRGSAFHFILWGVVIALANFTHFYLIKFTDFHSPYLIWLITIPAWIASFVYGLRKSKGARVKTYSDGLIMWVWLSFSFTVVILTFSGQFFPQLAALILSIAALPTFMTGLIIRFKPLIIGGSLFWIFSPIAFIVGPEYGLLISGIAIIVGYLIPGFLLRKQQ